MPNFDHLDGLSAAVIRLLREERERQSVSGKELARRCGLNQSTISLTDRGLRKPTLETLLRMADVLKVRLGDILLRAEAEGGAKAESKVPKKTTRKKG